MVLAHFTTRLARFAVEREQGPALAPATSFRLQSLLFALTSPTNHPFEPCSASWFILFLFVVGEQSSLFRCDRSRNPEDALNKGP